MIKQKFNPRKTIRVSIVATMIAVMFAGEIAAKGTPGTFLQTSVTELEVIDLFGRLHELLRNIAYLLGPIILLHGITLWALGTSESKWSEAGYSAMVGGFMLFGLALAMDILLQLAAFIGSAG